MTHVISTQTVAWKTVSENLDYHLHNAVTALTNGDDMQAAHALSAAVEGMPSGYAWHQEQEREHRPRAEALHAVAKTTSGWVWAGTNQSQARAMIERALAGEFDQV